MVKLTDKCRLWANVAFRTALRTYTNQINTETQTESKDFINRMFVMSEKDIRCNAKYTYECFGIVIPIDILQQYI